MVKYLNEKYSQYINFANKYNLLDRKMKNDLLTTVPSGSSGFESESAHPINYQSYMIYPHMMQ